MKFPGVVVWQRDEFLISGGWEVFKKFNGVFNYNFTDGFNFEISMKHDIVKIPGGISDNSEGFILCYLDFLDMGVGCGAPDARSIEENRSENSFIK